MRKKYCRSFILLLGVYETDKGQIYPRGSNNGEKSINVVVVSKQNLQGLEQLLMKYKYNNWLRPLQVYSTNNFQLSGVQQNHRKLQVGRAENHLKSGVNDLEMS